MTATDDLRAELTKRGVEWEDMSTRFPTGMLLCTSWTSQDGEPCTALEGADDIPDGKLSVQALLTPEQAITATLGAGTCEADETETIKCWVKCEDEPSTDHMDLIHVMECSACGGTYEHINGSYEFCPRCGRKVVAA